MKYLVFLMITISLISCKKKVVNESDTFVADPADFYQSQGNLLILVVTQGELEEAYEYQIDNIEYVNDSLKLEGTYPFPIGSGSSGIRYTILHPNADTLCTDQDWYTTFPVDAMASNELYRNSAYLPFNSAYEQDQSYQNNIDVWNVVANLDLLKTYRNESPESPIVFWGKSALHLNNQNISTLTSKIYVILTK